MIRRLSPTFNVNIDDLVYRGEGNNTIVLSDHTNGVIFRFRKTSVSSSEEENERERHKLKVPKCLSESYNFRYHVLRHSLGSEFVTPMQLLEVPSEVLRRIDDRLKPERPACRLKKSIDTAYRNVLRAPDACKLPPSYRPYGTGPIVCVEVKTKNGFILTSPQVHNRLDRTVCKFCMVQYHEKKTNMWNNRSSYCPCDLFSGQRPRMRRALKSLLRSPQINFRCFMDGRLHYSCNHELKPFLEFLRSFLSSNSDSENVEEFIDLLIDGLLFEFRKTQSQSSSDIVQYSLQCHEGIRKAYDDGEILITDGVDSRTQLPANSVLGRILSLQLRDSLGSHGIHPHLQRLKKHFEAIGLNWRWPLPSDEDHEERLHEWRLDSPELLESFRFVENYLIALVASDCSLMLTMQKAKPNVPANIPTISTRGGDKLLLNVVVVDLDPKSFGKVCERALSWNQEIVDNYQANRSPMPVAITNLLNLPKCSERKVNDGPKQVFRSISSSSSSSSQAFFRSSSTPNSIPTSTYSSIAHSASPVICVGPPCSSMTRPSS